MAAPWFRRTETIVSESSGVVNWRKKRLQAASKNPGSRVIYFRFSRYSNANPLRVMSGSKRQHRTMGAAGFGGSFAPIVQYEKWEINPVFPHFSYFRLCQNLSPNLLAPLCGVALIVVTSKKQTVCRSSHPEKLQFFY